MRLIAGTVLFLSLAHARGAEPDRLVTLKAGGLPGAPDPLVRGTNSGQTVELLLKRHGAPALNGSKSLFGVFAGAGYKIFPPNGSDEPEDKRYNGGYTVRTYGSHQGSGIDAIQ